jgi:hypothetical protein
MNHTVAAGDEIVHRLPVAEIAGHDLLIRAGGADIDNVGQAHGFGQMGQARAHDGAKAAGGAGDEQSLHESFLFHKAGVLEAHFPDNTATK